MCKTPLYRKGGKVLATKLRPIISYHLVWYSLLCKMVFKFSYHCLCLCIWKMINFPEVAHVINCAEIVSICKLKEINSHFGGARSVMVIVVGNGHGDSSSNPGRE